MELEPLRSTEQLRKPQMTSEVDPDMVASRIGELWSSRKQGVMGLYPPQNENRIMCSQAPSSSTNHAELPNIVYKASESYAHDQSRQGAYSPQNIERQRQTEQWSSHFNMREDGINMSVYTRRDAKVYLDKQRREWKVEWTEDGNVKMKRFSCKRWGKAKAKASAMEYYMLVLRGLPLHPNRPFFSQVRKLMDRKEQAMKGRPEESVEFGKSPKSNEITKRQDEFGWYPPSNSSVGRTSNRDEEFDNSVNLAWVCGNRTVDALCSAMSVSLGRNAADEGIIPYLPKMY